MAQDKVTSQQGTMPQNIMAWFPARLKLGQYPGRKLERARTAFLLTFRSGEVTLGSPPHPSSAHHAARDDTSTPAALLYSTATNA